jgi:undecaprenol kinase
MKSNGPLNSFIALQANQPSILPKRSRLKRLRIGRVAQKRENPLFHIPPNPFKAKHFWESIGFATTGLQTVFQTQQNFRTQVFVALGVVALGFSFHVSPFHWLALGLVMGLMLFAEAMNTAIELVVDLYTHGEFDIRAKIIKDIAAGACLITAITATTTGAIVSVPYIIQFLK